MAASMMLGVTVSLRDAFSAGARTIAQNMRGLGTTANRTAVQMQQRIAIMENQLLVAARSMMFGVTAMAYGMSAPIEAAREFNKTLKITQSIADAMDFEQVRKDVLKFSMAFPVRPEDIGMALYETVQSNFTDTADAVKVVTAGAKLATGSLADMERSTKGLTDILLSYRLAADESDRVAARMFETVRVGKVTTEELAATFGMFSPIAKAAGIELSEALSAIATTTLAGLSPEQAAQYNRQIVVGIIKPTRQAELAAQAIGVQWDMNALKTKGYANLLSEAYTKAITKFGESKGLKMFTSLLSGRQASTGALALLTNIDKMHRFTASIEASSDSVDQFGRRFTFLDRALRIMSESVDYQLKRLGAVFQALKAQVGTGFDRGVALVTQTLTGVLVVVNKLLLALPGLRPVISLALTALTTGFVMLGVAQLRAVFYSVRFRRVMTFLASNFNATWGTKIPASLGMFLRAWTFTLFKAASLFWFFRKMFQENWFGISTFFRDGADVIQAALLGLANQKYGVGWIPEKMAQDLEKRGLWGKAKALMMMLARLQKFGQGFAAAVRASFEGFWAGLRGVIEGIAKWLGKINPNWGKALEEWLALFNASSLRDWYRAGEAIGSLAGKLMVLASAIWAVRVAAFGLSIFGGLGRAARSVGRFALGGLIPGRGGPKSLFTPVAAASGFGAVKAAVKWVAGWTRTVVTAVGRNVGAVFFGGMLRNSMGRFLASVPGLFRGPLRTLGGLIMGFFRSVSGRGLLLALARLNPWTAALAGLAVVLGLLVMQAPKVKSFFQDVVDGWREIFRRRALSKPVFAKTSLDEAKPFTPTVEDFNWLAAARALKNGMTKALPQWFSLTDASLFERRWGEMQEWRANAVRMLTVDKTLSREDFRRGVQLYETMKAAAGLIAKFGDKMDPLKNQLGDLGDAIDDNTSAVQAATRRHTTPLSQKEFEARYPQLYGLYGLSFSRAAAARAAGRSSVPMMVETEPTSGAALHNVAEQIVELVRGVLNRPAVVEVKLDGQQVGRVLDRRNRTTAERSMTGLSPATQGAR